ncbi:MAG: NfeD family protein [Bacilli bacterium]
MFYIWLTIIIILSVIEVTTINIVTIWYVISGILVLIASFFIDSFLIQFGIFVILGTLLLFTTRPILTKLLEPIKQPTNLDRIIGMKGIVTEKITRETSGEVKVDGKRWTAISELNSIEKEEIVIIKSIEGIKVIVVKED